MCAIYFPTQAALARHKKAKICLTVNECEEDDDDYVVRIVPDDESELMTTETLPAIVHVEPLTARNIFAQLDLFANQFEDVE